MTDRKLATSKIDLACGRFDIEQHIAEPMSAAHWHDHVELNLLLSGDMSYLFNGCSRRWPPHVRRARRRAPPARARCVAPPK